MSEFSDGRRHDARPSPDNIIVFPKDRIVRPVPPDAPRSTLADRGAFGLLVVRRDPTPMIAKLIRAGLSPAEAASLAGSVKHREEVSQCSR